MKIVNGKKFYAADIKAAQRIDGNGWDRYNGQNWQWYSLFYNPSCGLVVLQADNSGSCYGDYTDRYFDSPAAFKAWCESSSCRDWAELMGDIGEQNECALDFIAHMLTDCDKAPCNMTADALQKVAAFAAEQAELCG